MTEDTHKDWTAHFEQGWLKNFVDTKSIDWKLYRYVRNKTLITSEGLDLAQSKLLLVSSAGAYLDGKDKPFNVANLLGDYSIRTFPATVQPDELQYAHDHYDQTAVREDMQVLLPLAHLQALVDERVIGALSDTVVSFMGYQPFVNRVINKTLAKLREIVKKEAIDAVLLVPS